MRLSTERFALWLCIGILAVRNFIVPDAGAPSPSPALPNQATSMITCHEDCVLEDLLPVDEEVPARQLLRLNKRKLLHATIPTATVTGATTITTTSSTITFCNTAGGAITITLPNANAVGENSNLEQRQFTIINTGGNDCTVASAANIKTNVITSATSNNIGGLTVTVDSSGYDATVTTTIARNDFAVASTFTDGSSSETVFTGASNGATSTSVTKTVVTGVAGTIGNTYSGAMTATNTIGSTGSITASAGGNVAATTTISAGTAITSATSHALKPGASIVLVADGTDWYQIGGTYAGY